MAKFPSLKDGYDVGAWEMVLNQLAKKVGINVPEAQVAKLGSPHHIFLLKRFDRIAERKRRHFASAMTLLKRNDGDDYSSGVSYLDIVSFIKQFGSQPERDLKELWTRIVFSIFVSNTDDHLRNHGFILEEAGWRLSPAYDVNPNPMGDGLKLNISMNNNAQNTKLIRSVSHYFDVDSFEADRILQEVKKIVVSWPDEAQKLKISRIEQREMKRAFRVAEEH